MEYPQNWTTAQEVESIVKKNGATPATIAILNGRVKIGKFWSWKDEEIGLTDQELKELAEYGKKSKKCSRRYDISQENET